MAKNKKLPKDIQISVRCNSRFKNLLIELAEGENRSLSNMLEVAVQSYARAAGYEALGTETSGKPAKKKVAKKAVKKAAKKAAKKAVKKTYRR